MDTKELLEKRAKAIADARAILENAKKEGRGMTTEENTNYDKAIDKAQDYGNLLAKEHKQAELEREIATVTLNTDKALTPAKEKVAEQMSAFGQLLMHGKQNVSDKVRTVLNALQEDVDTAGGFTVPPQQFVTMLIKAIDDLVFLRGLATVTTVVKAKSLGIPSLDNDPADADWTSEIATGDEDSTLSFGKRELNPHPLAKRIKVSDKLIRNSALDVVGIVIQRLGYKFGVTEEKAYLTGDGSGKPLGVFTASTDGISTGRDVSSGNTNTTIGADNLRNVKYSLKAGYWPDLRWIFHRDAVKAISKLKDGEGQYLWQQGLTLGDPDRLLAFPILMSEFAPNTFTTGQYVGILGSFKHYWIADALSMTMKRLDELYAETNQVGFIGRKETDGMPVLEEAFARVTLT